MVLPGLCNSGKIGDGICSCKSGYIGNKCDQCDCYTLGTAVCIKSNGTCVCKPGFKGMKCMDCLLGFFGPNCSSACGTCENSFIYIDGVNGTCSCDQEDPLKQLASNQSQTETVITIQGNTNLNQMQLNLSSFQLNIEKDLTLSNSTIIFDASTINVKGCISIENTSVTVDLSRLNTNNTIEKKILIQSSINCINGDLRTINYINQPSCASVEDERTTSTISVILTKKTNCNSEDVLSGVIVVIIIAVAILIVLTIIIIMATPKLRNAVLPHLARRNNRDKEKSIQNLQDKVSTLQSEIKEVKLGQQRVESLMKDN